MILIRPEVFVTFSAKKFDEKTLELTDQATKDMVKLQLEAFEKFVRKHTGRNSMTRLAGRTAIVTGGAKGIGRHYSQALAAEGAEVMIADVADGSRARRGDRRPSTAATPPPA